MDLPEAARIAGPTLESRLWTIEMAQDRIEKKLDKILAALQEMRNDDG
jgi:hypothetical protein